MHRLVNDMIRLPVKQSGPRLLQLDDVPAVHVVAAHQHQVVHAGAGAGQDQDTGSRGVCLLQRGAFQGWIDPQPEATG